MLKLAIAAMALGLAGAAVAEIPKVLPGEWEAKTTMHMQTMPNMPPQVAAAIKKREGTPMVHRYCITPEDAAKGYEKAMAEKNCKTQNFSYAGGHMTGESVCRGEDGRETRMKMSGSYAPTAYDMNGAMSSSGGSGGPMAMTMHVEGKRVAAACSAATMNAKPFKPPASFKTPPAPR